MKYSILCILFLFVHTSVLRAQFTFELKIDKAMRVGNTDQFSVSGTILSGRIEKGKTYFLEDGTKLVIQNILSSKTATSVPVAQLNEDVSLAMTCANFTPDHGDVMRAITTRPTYGSAMTYTRPNALPEGLLSCRVNGKLYRAKSVSKPVLVRASNILDLFFIADDGSVIWLQLNGFADIKETPFQTKSDTSVKEHARVCKVAFMPKGYRPTDMPTHYKAFEDLKGNAGIVVTALNRYRKTISLEFSGILRPNAPLLEEQEDKSLGLFYITEGRVDQISWDDF